MTLLQKLYAETEAMVDGKPISVPRLTEIADAEAEAARAYLARINDAAEKSFLPHWAKATLYEKAAEVLQLPFSTGGQVFNQTMFGSASGLLYLGWLSLRVKQPEIKLSDASALFSAHPEALNDVTKAWGAGKNLMGPA